MNSPEWWRVFSGRLLAALLDGSSSHHIGIGVAGDGTVTDAATAFEKKNVPVQPMQANREWAVPTSAVVVCP